MFSNFVPKKIITIDDRDQPWMSEFIESKVVGTIVFAKDFRIILGVLQNMVF